MGRLELETLGGDTALELAEFDSPPGDPVELLRGWLTGAVENGVREPGAMVLATTDPRGRPSTRVVLVKEIDDRGVVFGTDHGSRKGRELAAVAWAAGTLYWRETLQQISVAGPVEWLSDHESDALFAERSVPAQAAAIAARQSQPLRDRTELRGEAERLAAGDSPLPRPADWGGIRLVPERVEFWHGSTDRLHRRLHYEWIEGAWTSRRLQP
ncbi:pyridoxamine 5'-phosphate oxidase [Saccharopolyspora lacisalsi]|uniref:Pyridoxamine 5'-phosphate oxidase n=1 Tax=Halosaccharopolyspora lacisalsi TaxID=1000566 RepID=A0A839E2P3_9PSEU|nr:phenazine biosynthesis FMN-dependent oxidase PhzG [Halosaccharopolyspora lacisalsi]MBA8826015.1 pyridoxamine 5'-phosphate oxidase [Halosaccharopolyspora lacisalsi]